MQEIQPPNPLKVETKFSVFLAGSIEQGKAEDWQKKFVKKLDKYDITFLNPRRDDWDSSWGQTKEDENFVKQVTWELDALEKADLVIVYFDPNTKSPITIGETYLYVKSGKLIVCCPEGFVRKGNIDVTCDYYKVPQANTLDELIELTKLKFLNDN